jgi:hypothetical protein
VGQFAANPGDADEAPDCNAGYLVAKYTPDGNLQWSQATPSDCVYSTALAVDPSSGEIVFALWTASPYMHGLAQQSTIYGAGLTKLSPSGAPVWSQSLFAPEQCIAAPEILPGVAGGPDTCSNGAVIISGIAIGPAGNILITGGVGGPATPTELGYPADAEVSAAKGSLLLGNCALGVGGLVAMLASDGTTQWVRQFDSSASAAVFDSSGDVVISAYLPSSYVNLGGADLSAGTTSGAAFGSSLASYTVGGAHLWSEGSSCQAGLCQLNGLQFSGGSFLAAYPSGGFLAAGEVDGIASFGGVTVSDPYTDAGGSVGYVMRFP